MAVPFTGRSNRLPLRRAVGHDAAGGLKCGSQLRCPTAPLLRPMAGMLVAGSKPSGGESVVHVAHRIVQLRGAAKPATCLLSFRLPFVTGAWRRNANEVGGPHGKRKRAIERSP